MQYINNSEIVVENMLSINYEDSQKISENNYDDVKFTVTNSGSEIEYYYIAFNGIETTKDFSYVLESDDDTYEGIVKNGTIVEKISINPGDTKKYVLNIEYEKKYVLNGIIEVKNIYNNKVNFNDLLIENNPPKEEPLTTIGKEVSNTDEGLIKEYTEDGTTYYFRGNVTNNYVSFADYTWRVVRINEDNSVKLVLDNNIDVISSYYISGESYSYSESKISLELDSWFQNNLNTYSDIITNYNFCEDNTLVNSQLNTYAAYNRAVDSKVATYSCLGQTHNLKIGLLTIDEVLYAGASYNSGASEYYLNNADLSEEFYLMSPASISGNSYYPFVVSKDGVIKTSVIGTSFKGIRPVINVIGNVVITGEGTKDNPYVINM